MRGPRWDIRPAGATNGDLCRTQHGVWETHRPGRTPARFGHLDRLHARPLRGARRALSGRGRAATCEGFPPHRPDGRRGARGDRARLRRDDRRTGRHRASVQRRGTSRGRGRGPSSHPSHRSGAPTASGGCGRGPSLPRTTPTSPTSPCGSRCLRPGHVVVPAVRDGDHRLADPRRRRLRPRSEPAVGRDEAPHWLTRVRGVAYENSRAGGSSLAGREHLDQRLLGDRRRQDAVAREEPTRGESPRPPRRRATRSRRASNRRNGTRGGTTSSGSPSPRTGDRCPMTTRAC